MTLLQALAAAAALAVGAGFAAACCIGGRACSPHERRTTRSPLC